jgi:hypothetical protein
MEPQTETAWKRPKVSTAVYVLGWTITIANVACFTMPFTPRDLTIPAMWASIFFGIIFLAIGKILSYLSQIEHHLRVR